MRQELYITKKGNGEKLACLSVSKYVHLYRNTTYIGLFTCLIPMICFVP